MFNVSLGYVLSFSGMVAVVILLTNWTKEFWDKRFWNRTKYIVLGYSVIFSIIGGALLGKFSTAREVVETCVIWLLNSAAVWFTAMKAYETVSEERPMSTEDTEE